MASIFIRENAGSAKDHAQNVIQLSRATGPAFNAIIFKCILNEDNDGAPDCYGPLDMQPPITLDHLANGTNNGAHRFSKDNHNFLWRGVVSMTLGQYQKNTAYKLDSDDPRLEDQLHRFPVQSTSTRFYVSRTSLATKNAPEWDQTRYLNARTVPYGALSPPLINLGVSLGDLGFAIRGDKRIGKGFVFGDGGVQDKVGEVSRNVFRTFFPRVDQENHPVTFIVFPGVRAGSFESLAIDNAVRRIIRNLGPASNPDPMVRFLSFPPLLALSGPRGLPAIEEPPPPPKDPSQMDRLRDAMRKPPGPDAAYRNDYLNLMAVLRQFGLP